MALTPAERAKVRAMVEGLVVLTKDRDFPKKIELTLEGVDSIMEGLLSTPAVNKEEATRLMDRLVSPFPENEFDSFAGNVNFILAVGGLFTATLQALCIQVGRAHALLGPKGTPKGTKIVDPVEAFTHDDPTPPEGDLH